MQLTDYGILIDPDAVGDHDHRRVVDEVNPHWYPVASHGAYSILEEPVGD
jgi:hypothetical protein